MTPLVYEVQESIRAGQYRSSSHAESEREAEGILARQIEEVLLSPECEVVEAYSDDLRGHSALVLGFSSEGLPLHALLGFAEADIMVVITVYRPDPGEWIDWRVRRG